MSAHHEPPESSRELRTLEHHTFAIDASGKTGFDTREVPYVIIATQDCDLFKDYKARSEGKPGTASGVLLFEAQNAPKAKDSLKKGRDEWKQIKNNVVDRFQYLEAWVPPQGSSVDGLPELLIDFSRYFTLLPTEIERQIGAGSARRRVRVNSPYRDRLQNRAAFFLQRIALPDDYDS